MKPSKQVLKDALKNLSGKKIKEALKWIDSLSEKELGELEQFSIVQLAQFLLANRLKGKPSNSKKQAKE